MWLDCGDKVINLDRVRGIYLQGDCLIADDEVIARYDSDDKAYKALSEFCAIVKARQVST